MNRIIPRLECGVPKRVYYIDGGVITCKEILKLTPGVEPLVSEGETLFVMCLSVEKAKMLMEDLYYGQYTGG